MLLRYILFWFVLLLAAIGNGVLREVTYGNSVNELTAHQLSTLTGILFSGVLVWFISGIWSLQSSAQAWMVGISWLMLTIGFEFIFGYYIADHTWEMLFHDYNLLAGRVWLVFLVWICVMPYIFFKFNAKRNH